LRKEAMKKSISDFWWSGKEVTEHTFSGAIVRKRSDGRILVSGWLGKDRLCGLVVRVHAYRFRGPEFDSRRYQMF
jgi:hypothetical protein